MNESLLQGNPSLSVTLAIWRQQVQQAEGLEQQVSKPSWCLVCQACPSMGFDSEAQPYASQSLKTVQESFPDKDKSNNANILNNFASTNAGTLRQLAYPVATLTP